MAITKTLYAQAWKVTSGRMSPTKPRWTAFVAIAVLLAGSQFVPAVAMADPETDPQTQGPPAPEGTAPQPEVLHNVIYRARADGTSRDAVVAYKMDDKNVNSAQPTMLPGQTFEVNAVLADPKLAGMELSIEWPYGSNLHCEILVDDQIVAQADQFIAPRLLRPKNDPLYGVLQCGAPLDIPVEDAPAPDAAATDSAIPVDGTTPLIDPNAPLPADASPPPA
jgi:hypothetical protein